MIVFSYSSRCSWFLSVLMHSIDTRMLELISTTGARPPVRWWMVVGTVEPMQRYIDIIDLNSQTIGRGIKKVPDNIGTTAAIGSNLLDAFLEVTGHEKGLKWAILRLIWR